MKTIQDRQEVREYRGRALGIDSDGDPVALLDGKLKLLSTTLDFTNPGLMHDPSMTSVAYPLTILHEYPRPNVGLSLTHDQAEFLCDVMGRIGGSPTKSRRVYADMISTKLRNAGVQNTTLNDYDPSNPRMYFVDTASE